ncbi:protein kinase family protein [Pseudalkalibacillus sp. SCS-8]|uniref:protein kinase family protein n=1 Tax=Pseudalkalibacillus nanhaiensis TaxID=3115291 RepID=UPI0032DB6CFD
MQPTPHNLVDQVIIQSNQLIQKPSQYTLIGKGRSAFVFLDEGNGCAIKIFFEEFEHLAKQEGDIYKRLKGCPYFPNVYEVGPNYLVMDYIEGMTFYQCLQKGIPITDEMVEKVEEALSFARQQGLNPSDIHLQNLLYTKDGTVKVIDVVRFTQDKVCHQWDDLREAHQRIYQRKYFIFKRIPKPLIDTVAFLYKKIIIPFRSLRLSK